MLARGTRSLSLSLAPSPFVACKPHSHARAMRLWVRKASFGHGCTKGARCHVLCHFGILPRMDCRRRCCCFLAPSAPDTTLCGAREQVTPTECSRRTQTGDLIAIHYVQYVVNRKTGDVPVDNSACECTACANAAGPREPCAHRSRLHSARVDARHLSGVCHARVCVFCSLASQQLGTAMSRLSCE